MASWGRVAQMFKATATPREMIAKREYRAPSPAFLFHPKTRHIVQLNSAGLVHNPNLHLTAAIPLIGASQEPGMPPETPPAAAPDLAAAMARMPRLTVHRLPADTPVDEVMAALAARLSAPPDPAKFMPMAAVQQVLQDRTLELAPAHQDRILGKVNKAEHEGYVHPGMRDWARALCRSDEAAFDTYMAKAGSGQSRAGLRLFVQAHTHRQTVSRQL